MMALSSIPNDGITLHGVQGMAGEKHGSTSAVLLKLNDGLLQNLRKASHTKEGVQFLSGSSPKLRIGGRIIDLNLSPEAFRTELYASTAGSLTDLTFSGVVSHRAEVQQRGKTSGDDTAGSDAALAALQSSMASYEKEKQANQSNIVNAVLPTMKSRTVPGKQTKRSLLGPGQPLSSPMTAPQHVTASSAATSDAAIRSQALKTPVIHLLALKPTSTEHITSKTHIPKEDLENILQKIAKHQDGKWHLSDRAYKELDVWKFGYTSQEDRQLAIDNSIRAYDRQRIGKEEPIWQQLLPKEDRDKGIVLSRLNAGGSQVNRGLTPNYTRSPLLQGEVSDSKPASAVNTPKLGASTPRPTSAKGDVMKRLMAKDPKKARLMEEAKEKKRKEKQATREATASDREMAKPAKKQTTTTTTTTTKANAKVKSAAVVHSSDDESGEEGEVKDEITRVDSRLEPEQSNPVAKSKPGTSGSLRNGDAPTTTKAVSEKSATKSKALADPAKSIASLVSKAATPIGAGKSTPRTNNNLAAPSSQHKSQRSPHKADSRPNVPSPLGAARPRLASDVSDRSAIGVQRARPGAGPVHGLGITNGSRKRQDTVTSTASTTSSGSDKIRTDDVSSQKPQKSVAITGSSNAPTSNGATPKAETGVKRKATDKPTENYENAPAAKHRKTESSSSVSQKSHASSIALSTARTSPSDSALDSGSSDNSAVSVIDAITYTQGVGMAQEFRDKYYPAYAQLYDAQAAKEARGEKIEMEERNRLWKMHRRLEQMKREIITASEREHRED